MKPRAIAWLTCFLVSMVACLNYALSTPEFNSPSYGRVVWFCVIGCSGLLSVLLQPQFGSARSIALAIWVPTILLRLAILPTAPSDDVNRYLWEGRLVVEGVSPYVGTAYMESLTEYRDGYWEAMNHKDQMTAYPPLTALSFGVVSGIWYHPMAFKVVFLLVDLLVVLGLLKLLQRRGLSIAYVGFYAWNPLALVAFAGEGHFDVMMLAALVWAVLAWELGRKKTAAVLLSIATGIKWVTLPLLAFLIRKFEDWKLVVVMLVVLLLPGLFFWETLSALIQGLLAYGGARSFNGPIYDLLFFGLDLPRSYCTFIVLIGFVGLVTWRWFWRQKDPLELQVLWVLGGLIILSPTVHFWYVVWILPFVCLRPSLPWLSFSISAAVYFIVWIRWDAQESWTLSNAQRVLFWAPFFISVIYEIWSTRGRVILPVKRAENEVVSVAVIIPAYHVGEELLAAIASVRQQTEKVVELIISDAGDLERTRELTAEYEQSVRILSSEKGRGQQISAGIAGSSSDWVIVLHADTRLHPEAVASLKRAARLFPNMIGGAFGQRFSEQSWSLLCIELLNDLRATFTRTAFGDQIQFFHRDSAVVHQLMPAQPLMEDVESSWRVRELGEFRFLGLCGDVSAAKWLSAGWRARVRLVLRLVSKYRWARLKGRAQAEALSADLYAEYYSGK